MNKKGNLKSALIILGVVILLFGLVFALINFGYIEFVGDPEQDFISTNVNSNSGYNSNLEIKNFRFCYGSQAEEGCEDEENSFFPGEEVFFFFEVEAKTVNGSVKLIKNYALTDYNGVTLIERDPSYDEIYEAISDKEEELVYYYDSIKLGEEQSFGDYTLELIILNSLTGDEVVMTRTFEVHDIHEGIHVDELYETEYYYGDEGLEDHHHE